MSCRGKGQACAQQHKGPSGVPDLCPNGGIRQCSNRRCRGFLTREGYCPKCSGLENVDKSPASPHAYNDLPLSSLPPHPQSIPRKVRIGVISPDLEAGQFFVSAMKIGCDVVKVEVPPRVIGSKKSEDPEVAHALARGVETAIIRDGYNRLTIACNTLSAGWWGEARKILEQQLKPEVLAGLRFISTVDAMKIKFRNIPKHKRPTWFGTSVIVKMPEVHENFPVPNNELQELTQRCIWTVKAQGGADVSGACGNIVTGTREQVQAFYEYFAQRIIDTLPKDADGLIHCTMGCTEIPIWFSKLPDDLKRQIVAYDPAEEVATMFRAMDAGDTVQ